jgi:hypothetical protein
MPVEWIMPTDLASKDRGQRRFVDLKQYVSAIAYTLWSYYTRITLVLLDEIVQTRNQATEPDLSRELVQTRIAVQAQGL